MVAAYDYDPHSDSPNDNPELELSFKAGDALTVYGNIVSDWVPGFANDTYGGLCEQSLPHVLLTVNTLCATFQRLHCSHYLE